MNKFINALLYLWQLPQNLVGLAMLPFLGKRKIVHGCSPWGKVYRCGKMRGGISLGHYIYVPYYIYSPNYKFIKHEVGHRQQSLYLGWLYLIVIGLPSLIWATLHTYVPAVTKKSYYWFYTERWANKLAGIELQ